MEVLFDTNLHKNKLHSIFDLKGVQLLEVQDFVDFQRILNLVAHSAFSCGSQDHQTAVTILKEMNLSPDFKMKENAKGFQQCVLF